MSSSVESIFAEALHEPDPARRAAYVATACGEDLALRNRIEALLRAHDEAGTFMRQPAAMPTVPESSGPGPAALRDALPEGPGTVIGHYKLLQRIGEGGFGTVWMADQERPVRRRVA